MGDICKNICKFMTRFLQPLILRLCGIVGIAVVPPGCRVIPAGHFNFDPNVVKAFGGSKSPSSVTKAIIYQKVQGWIEDNRRAGRNHRNGETWSYNTYAQWAAEISIFHQKTIEKHIRDMEALGLFSSREFDAAWGSRRKYYTSPLRLSDDLSQMLLWSEAPTPTGGADVSDITMKKPTTNKPSMKKRSTTATARAGVVASFPMPPDKAEMAEILPSMAEVRPGTNEGDDSLASEGTPDNASASQTSPSSAPPPSDLAEFFSGCSADELQDLLQKYSESRLREAMVYTQKARNVQNPPGLALTLLAKGWLPAGMPPEMLDIIPVPNLDTTESDTASATGDDLPTEPDADDDPTPAVDVPLIDEPEAKAWASLRWAIDAQTYEEYFKPAKLVSVSGAIWTIHMPSAYLAMRIQHPRLLLAVRRVLGEQLNVAPESIELRFEAEVKVAA